MGYDTNDLGTEFSYAWDRDGAIYSPTDGGQTISPTDLISRYSSCKTVALGDGSSGRQFTTSIYPASAQEK